MSWEDAIQNYLDGSPVSVGVGARVYRYTAPERATYPYLVLGGVAAMPLHTHGGPTTLQQRWIQIDVVTLDHREARTIADAVRLALDGFAGDMGGLTFGAILFKNEVFDRDVDTKAFCFHLDFDIKFQEP